MHITVRARAFDQQFVSPRKTRSLQRQSGRVRDNRDAAEHFAKLHSILRDGVGVPEDKAEYIVGPWLTFDPKTERHTGDHAEEANQLLRDPRNAGFELPSIS